MTADERATKAINGICEESYSYAVDDSYGIATKHIANAVREAEQAMKERCIKVLEEKAVGWRGSLDITPDKDKNRERIKAYAETFEASVKFLKDIK